MNQPHEEDWIEILLDCLLFVTGERIEPMKRQVAISIRQKLQEAERLAKINELNSLRIHVEALAELGYNQMTEVLHELDNRIKELQQRFKS
jgi:hypothetical protein